MDIYSLTFVVAFVYLCAGLGLGWWLHSRFNQRLQSESSGEHGTKSHNRTLDQEQANELLRRMHHLASAVAHDVEEHSGSLSQATQELAALASHDDTTSGAVIKIIGRVIKSSTKLQASLDEAQQKIQAQAEQLRLQMAEALTDGLTGLPNRRAFDREIDRRIAEWERTKTPVSIALLDVDRFKLFNDLYGHQTGDEVLRGVAAALSATLRRMDMPARYGGDEFTAILPITDLELGASFAERLRAAIEDRRFCIDGQEFHVTVSIGIAQINDGECVSSLIRRADEALYASKRAGRNCVHRHDGTSCQTVPPIRASSNVERPTTIDAAAAHPVGRGVPGREQPNTGWQVSQQDMEHPRTDPETGLANRTVFFEELRRRLAERKRHRTPTSAMLVGLNQLARFSDAYGPTARDLILKAVPRFLTAVTRQTDLIARYSDDQFGVVLVQTDETGAITAAERVRQAISRCDKLCVDGKPIEFTVSVGVAEAQDTDDSASLARRAERALANSKATTPTTTWFDDGVTCQQAQFPGTLVD